LLLEFADPICFELQEASGAAFRIHQRTRR
jgi:hypothetical protein